MWRMHLLEHGYVEVRFRQDKALHLVLASSSLTSPRLSSPGHSQPSNGEESVEKKEEQSCTDTRTFPSD